jgi:hypothetical protein
MFNHTRTVNLSTFLDTLITDIQTGGLWELVSETDSYYYIRSNYTSNKSHLIRLGKKELFQSFIQSSYRLYIDFAEIDDDNIITDRDKTFSNIIFSSSDFQTATFANSDFTFNYFLKVTEKFIHIVTYILPYQGRIYPVCQLTSFGILDDSSKERYTILLTDVFNANKDLGDSTIESNQRTPFGYSFGRNYDSTVYGLVHKAAVTYKYDDINVTTSSKVDSVSVSQMMTRTGGHSVSVYYNGTYEFNYHVLGSEKNDTRIVFSGDYCSSTVTGEYMGTVPFLLQNEQVNLQDLVDNGYEIEDGNGNKFKLFNIHPYNYSGGSFYKVVAIQL